MKRWWKSGAPWVWLNAGAVAVSIIMVLGLIGLIAVRGLSHFYPSEIVEFQVGDPERGIGQMVMGEHVRSETIPVPVARDAGIAVPPELDNDDLVVRHLIKQGNRDVTGQDFAWYAELQMSEWQAPPDAMRLERREWGDFYGYPLRVVEDGEVVAEGEGLWEALQSRVDRANTLFRELRRIERNDVGVISADMEAMRLRERALQRDPNIAPEALQAELGQIQERQAELQEAFQTLRGEIDILRDELYRDTLVASVVSGQEVAIRLGDIVRAVQPNSLSLSAKAVEYVQQFWAFVSGEPREANTAGGIFPAIFGTVTMVLLMSMIVSPFGVLAAIYLREYARQGPLLRLIRISVYNLAGVPSIVYGVFGLGFFIYTLGGSIDDLFYADRLPSPTFGSPALIWASLTLALLTLPVVIVSTEEGLARIPSSVRHGSLALGATKSETLWKVVVPLATPAMMTGMILAIARAAGEVAPLMLVGVVKLAPTLPVDGTFPFIHLDRQIMHLGFHIYDVGFQSPNVEAARPLVYATALVLVILIIVLNLTAISIRNRLRERYRAASD
ncbi:phosphate ABC transporter permease PstA [Halomonas campisalis]|uniref:Phosphate transport system permease protein PstA n=1 Tax=Billgrantia campisalis TaxID=74661 RepID=A0ABS9P6P0_9GAMM|nr:phosphate ABC transporter permease PstA [Halomonas campisalis]MCG6657251.1 phosphate ABC transporter permease PstA [Halomonas campisalis]MDR5864207.1 phosphate ABC transporter permease PstA [Halomonas campisalis]